MRGCWHHFDSQVKPLAETPRRLDFQVHFGGKQGFMAPLPSTRSRPSWCERARSVIACWPFRQLAGASPHTGFSFRLAFRHTNRRRPNRPRSSRLGGEHPRLIDAGPFVRGSGRKNSGRGGTDCFPFTRPRPGQPTTECVRPEPARCRSSSSDLKGSDHHSERCRRTEAPKRAARPTPSFGNDGHGSHRSAHRSRVLCRHLVAGKLIALYRPSTPIVSRSGRRMRPRQSRRQSDRLPIHMPFAADETPHLRGRRAATTPGDSIATVPSRPLRCSAHHGLMPPLSSACRRHSIPDDAVPDSPSPSAPTAPCTSVAH